jgi:hypothetical protein
MPDEKQIPDYYSDSFQVVAGPYGVVLKFAKAMTEIPASGTLEREQVATIRMSWEHAKTMTFKMAELIKRIEEMSNVSYPLPVKVMTELNVPKKEWDSFWEKPKSKPSPKSKRTKNAEQ